MDAGGGPGRYGEFLDWIDGREEETVARVTRWAAVNSGSRNRPGLAAMLAVLREDYGGLGGEVDAVPLPGEPGEAAEAASPGGEPARALSVRRRPDAPVQVLLVGHLDTVFGPDHAFRQVSREADGTLRGPGVLDAKGGLAVLLLALEALERSPWADGVGWEVLITPDEELGSPGSAPLLSAAAARHDLGLVYEPAQPDGALVGARKGSGNFTVVVHGREAHAGRNPADGRNAVVALAELVVALAAAGRDRGILVNPGRIEGGGELNVVPARAACGFNVRVDDAGQEALFRRDLARIVGGVAGRDGFRVAVEGGFGRPPKVVDGRTRSLYEALAESGRRLGLALAWRPSGGASDGNLLAAAGLPTADGLGPRGDGLHTETEHLVIESLAERARLSALFLMRLGAGEPHPWTGRR